MKSDDFYDLIINAHKNFRLKVMNGHLMNWIINTVDFINSEAPKYVPTA